MHYVQALISVGLFGWLGYAVAFDALPDEAGGSSKTRALTGLADTLTSTFGAGLSGALLFSIGIILAWFFLRRGAA